MPRPLPTLPPSLTTLPTQGHHAGAALVGALPPLLAGDAALSTLLLHNNQLPLAAIEQVELLSDDGTLALEADLCLDCQNRIRTGASQY